MIWTISQQSVHHTQPSLQTACTDSGKARWHACFTPWGHTDYVWGNIPSISLSAHSFIHSIGHSVLEKNLLNTRDSTRKWKHKEFRSKPHWLYKVLNKEPSCRKTCKWEWQHHWTGSVHQGVVWEPSGWGKDGTVCTGCTHRNAHLSLCIPW